MAHATKLPLVAALLAVGGCAVPWNVDTYTPPGGDVASRTTFHWRGGEFVTGSLIDDERTDEAEALVRAAVVRELSARGYREVGEPTQAQMHAAFRVSGVRRTVLAETPRVGAPSPNTVLSPGETQPPPASELPREITVREGSVVVYLDDAATGRLLWRGEVATELRAGSAEQAARRVTQIAREIARQVPARRDP